MSRRAAIAGTALAVLALWAWYSQLTVSLPGETPRPLYLYKEMERRPHTDFDVVLPAVPVGMAHLRDGEAVLLVHYWAPWERHSALQAAALDSLRRLERFERLRAVVVCFDPYPSVARFVARHGLRVSVLLDHDRRLREVLPCPSVPFTYVIDRAGRVAIAQPGQVDWLAAETRAALARLLEE